MMISRMNFLRSLQSTISSTSAVHNRGIVYYRSTRMNFKNGASSMRQENIISIATGRRSLSQCARNTIIPVTVTNRNNTYDNHNNHHELGNIRNMPFTRLLSSSPSPSPSSTKSTSIAKNPSKDDRDINYDGVSDEVAKLINDHAKQSPTSVSLQALMRTGRGEYLDRHFEHVAMKEHTATELVLMQVRSINN
jgi:hypothetical protein